MAGFEPSSSGVRSDRSTNRAAAIVLTSLSLNQCLHFVRKESPLDLLHRSFPNSTAHFNNVSAIIQPAHRITVYGSVFDL